jgi:endonuclease-8
MSRSRELTRGRDLERSSTVQTLGPDILADNFDAADAARRITTAPDKDITAALLNQQAVAGIGNIFKCESLYVSGLYPFTRVADLSLEDITRVVEKARSIDADERCRPANGVLCLRARRTNRVAGAGPSSRSAKEEMRRE